MFCLDMVDCFMDLPSCLKVLGWWVVCSGGGLKDFSVSPGTGLMSQSQSKSLSEPE